MRGIKNSLNYGIILILTLIVRPAQLFNPTFAIAISGEFFHPYVEKHFLESNSNRKFAFPSSIKRIVVV